MKKLVEVVALGDMIQFAILLVLIITALVAYRQFRNLIREQKRSRLWERMRETKSALRHVNSQNNRLLRNTFASELDDVYCVVPLSRIMQLIDDLPGLSGALIDRLNACEGLATGIEAGLYDESLIRLSRETAMRTTYFTFSEYIANRQKTTSQTLFSSLQRMVKTWEAELANQNRSRIKNQSSLLN